MFIKKTKDVLALDDEQLRGRADTLINKRSTMNGLAKIMAATFLGTTAVVLGIGFVVPALLLPSGLIGFGAACLAVCGKVMHDRECLSEAQRLCDAADRREDLKNTARRATDDMAEKSLALSAPAVTMSPLYLKKNPAFAYVSSAARGIGAPST